MSSTGIPTAGKSTAIAHLAARITMAMLFAAAVSVLLTAFATFAGGVALAVVRWSALFGLAVLGVIPLSAIGPLVGSLCKASAVTAVLNLVYLPVSFVSGPWVPLGSTSSVGTGAHVAVLAAAALGFVAAARRVLGRAR